jgi:signal transduction histidine kinase
VDLNADLSANARLAHHIGNRLTVIIGALELISASQALPPDLQAMAAGALRASSDLCRLVQELPASGFGAGECSTTHATAGAPLLE